MESDQVIIFEYISMLKFWRGNPTDSELVEIYKTKSFGKERLADYYERVLKIWSCRSP